MWNSIPDSDRALPKYKFKNTLQSRLMEILIQEDTYVGVRNLFDIFSNQKQTFVTVHPQRSCNILKVCIFIKTSFGKHFFDLMHQV